MDLAALELQIFISLVVVLGTAFVALVCDFLKGNNERLRERNIEYRVRDEERGGGISPAELLRSLVEIGRNPELAARVLPGEAPPVASEVTEVAEPARVSTWATKEELERLAERTARIRARHEARLAGTTEAAPVETAGEAAPLEETGKSGTPAEAEPVLAPVLVPSPEREPEPEPAISEADIAGPEPAKVKVLAFDPGAVDRYEPVSEASLAAEAPVEEPSVAPAPEAPRDEQASEPAPEAVAEASVTGTDAEFPAGPEAPEEAAVKADEPAAEAAQPGAVEADVPPGLHPVAAVNAMLDRNGIFTGTAVSIGINDFASLRSKLGDEEGADSLAAVEQMVRELLEDRAFGCRFQEDEYILLFPGETEAAAQRRLFQVSEKLWDFQLRSLGQASVMFSWGGLEVQREPVKEAVAGARERMLQTKRNRKGAIEMKRKVVNG
jgi:GGDEF domain-containing protein